MKFGRREMLGLLGLGIATPAAPLPAQASEQPQIRAIKAIHKLLPGLWWEPENGPERDLISTSEGGIDLLVATKAKILRAPLFDATEIANGSYEALFFPRYRKLLKELSA